MARASVADRLRHILDAVAGIETLTAGKTFEDYPAVWVTRDAIERNLERVSEASRHIPAHLKTQHKGISWRAVRGLCHHYPRVKHPRVCRVATADLRQSRPRSKPHFARSRPRIGRCIGRAKP